eukprot:m.36568 g.36568  ORF g.36568 m.36568 type:complete len:541 (-) comp11033_c1_seq1:164-1786(-)
MSQQFFLAATKMAADGCRSDDEFDVVGVGGGSGASSRASLASIDIAEEFLQLQHDFKLLVQQKSVVEEQYEEVCTAVVESQDVIQALQHQNNTLATQTRVLSREQRQREDQLISLTTTIESLQRECEQKGVQAQRERRRAEEVLSRGDSPSSGASSANDSGLSAEAVAAVAGSNLSPLAQLQVDQLSGAVDALEQQLAEAQAQLDAALRHVATRNEEARHLQDQLDEREYALSKLQRKYKRLCEDVVLRVEAASQRGLANRLPTPVQAPAASRAAPVAVASSSTPTQLPPRTGLVDVPATHQPPTGVVQTEAVPVAVVVQPENSGSHAVAVQEALPLSAECEAAAAQTSTTAVPVPASETLEAADNGSEAEVTTQDASTATTDAATKAVPVATSELHAAQALSAADAFEAPGRAKRGKAGRQHNGAQEEQYEYEYDYEYETADASAEEQRVRVKSLRGFTHAEQMQLLEEKFQLKLRLEEMEEALRDAKLSSARSQWEKEQVSAYARRRDLLVINNLRRGLNKKRRQELVRALEATKMAA